MSKTPKTDAHIKEVEAMGLYSDMDVVTPEFAREQELEIARLNLKLGNPTDEANLNGSAYAQIKWWKDTGDDDQDLRRELELENAELLETLKKAERELSRLFEKISINGVLPSPSVMQDCVYVINKLAKKSND